MVLDLSALQEKPTESQGHGKPLLLPVADIIEDPNQPRKSFSEKKLKEMEASIRAKGVKVPISVKPHPEQSGKWIVNHGARRLRGSIMAEKETIPAFIDEAHDNFDQIIENLQRDDLEPMELALAIKDLMEKGHSQKEIASNLGKDSASITHILTLLDLPKCLDDAYRSGKSTSPKTLYELKAIYEKHPVHVEKWVSDNKEITRADVIELGDQMHVIETTGRIEDTNNPNFDIEGNLLADVAKNNNISDGNSESPPAAKPLNQDKPDTNKGLKLAKGNLPLIEVTYNKKSAFIDTKKKPSSDKRMFIRFFDEVDSESFEVLIKSCKLSRIVYE